MSAANTKQVASLPTASGLLTIIVLFATSCQNILEPEPIDLATDDVVLNAPDDVPNVEIGLYQAFRPIIPSMVIAGDMTADMLIHRGTFTNFRELGTKQISSANASAAALWGNIYNTVYLANFILEKLPSVPGVKTVDRDRVLATAHFLRGYAYFVAAYSFGGVPLVTTTDIETNRNIPRATKQEILEFVLDDYTESLGKLPESPVNSGYASEYAVQAALAKFYLYQEDWDEAEEYASNVINSQNFTLDTDFSTVVLEDFPEESIFEVAYTVNDDPGTNNSIGLFYLLANRREIIPSNQVILKLSSDASGDRFSSIDFNLNNLKGTDNGWSVAKYGNQDSDNNNVSVFRLAEMYLIRAEARAKQNQITSAISDLNILRNRAKADLVTSATQNQLIQLIEEERLYELAFEGHRWYDLVRTNRAASVMPVFNSNWKNSYEVWPIPQREIQNNPALKGNQNPGY